MLSEDYKDCLEYIDDYWNRVTVRPNGRDYLDKIILRRVKKKMHKNILDMPNAFIVPNDKKFTHVFYWDTFFIFKGLIRTEREWLLKAMVNNFVHLFDRYGIIPNFNSPASTGRSQPPFFTSMILDTYNGPYFRHLKKNGIRKIFSNFKKHKRWLSKVTKAAKREYWNVWMDPEGLFHHRVQGQMLNRYGDRDIGYPHSSELESGWDFTSRFYNRCNEFLPIDLNVYLFKYERDFAKIANHLQDFEDEKYWKKQAKKRRREIEKLMWNEKEGFFFDYEYVKGKKSGFYSLAGFTPLWAGFASAHQAKKMVEKLPMFETDHGLVITAKDSLAPYIELDSLPADFRPAIKDILRPKQWDYPNIWPPLEYLTVIGLLKYGYVKDAKRIMEKSVKAHSKIFRKHKTFFEKIDGVNCEKPNDFHYPSQTGFGWTNALFYRYIKILDAIAKKENIHISPKSKNPPHKLAIPH